MAWSEIVKDKSSLNMYLDVLIFLLHLCKMCFLVLIPLSRSISTTVVQFLKVVYLLVKMNKQHILFHDLEGFWRNVNSIFNSFTQNTCSKGRSYIRSQQYIFAVYEVGLMKEKRVSEYKAVQRKSKSKKVKVSCMCLLANNNIISDP